MKWLEKAMLLPALSCLMLHGLSSPEVFGNYPFNNNHFPVEKVDPSAPTAPMKNVHAMTDIDTTNATIAIIQKFNAAFNKHDADAVMANMTEDCIFENTNPAPDGSRYDGAAAVKAYWVKFFINNPDAYFEVEDMIASGDRCVVRWIYRKTKEGKPWHLRGVDIFKVRDGKVAEKFSYVKG